MAAEEVTLQHGLPLVSGLDFCFFQDIPNKQLTDKVTRPYNQGNPILLGGVILGTSEKKDPKTDNSKLYRMAIEYDEEYKQILDVYCEQENVSKMGAVRRGIKKLKDDLKR